MDYLKNMAEDVEQDGNDYCVLLLITDGGIAGMKTRFPLKWSWQLARPWPMQHGIYWIEFRWN